MAIRESGDLGVFRAANLGQIGHKFRIELLGARNDAGIFLLGSLKQVGRRRAISTPIGRQLFAEILDRINFVIGDEHMPLDRLGRHFAQIESESQRRQIVFYFARLFCVIGRRKRSIH